MKLLLVLIKILAFSPAVKNEIKLTKIHRKFKLIKSLIQTRIIKPCYEMTRIQFDSINGWPFVNHFSAEFVSMFKNNISYSFAEIDQFKF